MFLGKRKVYFLAYLFGNVNNSRKKVILSTARFNKHCFLESEGGDSAINERVLSFSWFSSK